MRAPEPSGDLDCVICHQRDVAGYTGQAGTRKALLDAALQALSSFYDTGSFEATHHRARTLTVSLVSDACLC